MHSVIAKSIARLILPQSALEFGKRRIASHRIRSAARVLAETFEGPDWLAPGLLSELSARYPVTRFFTPDISQSPDRFGAERIIKSWGRGARDFLEIGGGPGLVSWGLVAAERNATCLDILDEVAAGARASGVIAVVGDACHMKFADNSFDAAFSYNAFEHIDDPGKALNEAWRVVRPGGRVHLSFAPIYSAPLGLHAFYEFGIPYMQHLWDEDTLRPLVTSDDLWHLNGWSLTQYRGLWESFSNKLDRVFYSEEHDFQGLELIKEFPSCFVKRSRNIDEFTTSKLVVTFKVLK